MRRALLTVAAVAGLSGMAPGSAQVYTRVDADRAAKKVEALIARGQREAGGPAAGLRTTLSELEVNAYFVHLGPEFLPTGVVHPRLHLMDGSRVETRAVVDLDAVRLSQPRTWRDPLSYVSGSLEVRAVGTIRAANGRGQFELERATLGGVPMPKAFLQEVVSYYSRTETSPRGFQLDQPFDLPLQIRHVQVQRGSAVIVQ